MKRIAARLFSVVLVGMLPAAGRGEEAATTSPTKIDLTQQKWHGPALCYSGYRAGQTPKREIYPSQAQVLEDLRIMARHWGLIRLYGGDRHSEDVLEVIRREKLPIQVLLGSWLDGRPGYEGENAAQTATVIRLANVYKEIVAAVNVGNEILVSWSDHKLTEEQAIEYVRQVKAAVSCPVTIADDRLYWREPSAKLASAVDFIAMHSYPAWAKQDIDTALAFTIETYEGVRQAHPGKTIVITEAGWPSYTKGELHAPRAGDEQKQKRYFEELTAWARAHNVTVFFFEAFDEPWKGEGTEGHWGLFSEGRRAKLAVQALFPDLLPSGPTSPSYGAPPATPHTSGQGQ